MVRLVYLDPESGGYHTGHIVMIAEMAARDPRVEALHFVVGDQFDSFASSTIEELSSLSAKITFESLSPRFLRRVGAQASALRRSWAMWAKARELLKADAGAICFISLFDQPIAGSVWDRLGRRSLITGIIHAPPLTRAGLAGSFQHRRLLLKYLSYLFSGPKTSVVFTFDRYFIAHLPRSVRKKWIYIPDPIPISNAAHDRLTCALPPTRTGRIKLLLFGSLGRRKGLSVLLEAIRSLPLEVREMVEVQIVGRFSECTSAERQSFLRSIGSTIALDGLQMDFREEFVSGNDLVEYLIKCDVVLAPYENHLGVSSVILWAAAAGKPVLTQDTGWMGYVTEKESLGWTCDTGSAARLSELLCEVIGSHRHLEFDPEHLRRFANGHRPQDFYEALIGNLIKAK